MTKDPNQFRLDEETTDFNLEAEAVESGSADDDLLDFAGALHPRQKVSLIKHLITRLPSHELEVLQKIIKDEENERTQVEQQGMPLQLKVPVHRVKVKKDYNFRKLGLTHPQQYFISISAKYRVHNDIYLGVLFFIESGYSLDYVSSKLGVIQFNPETSIFRLESSISRRHKIVRLIMLTPPPPDYDVMKIKPETRGRVPCSLHIEILDDNLQVVEREQYQFPACMFRVEAFDRDYWDKVTVVESAGQTSPSVSASVPAISKKPSAPSQVTTGNLTSAPSASPPRVINLSKMESTPSPVFTISNPAKTSLMTSYLRQIVNLSQKAYPQQHWTLSQRGLNYSLLHSSKKLIVEIRVANQEILAGKTSLNVLSNWCRDLGVEVSQNVSTQYTVKEKEIGRNLMIEFSAQIADPLTFLEKFFCNVKGVQFNRKSKS